MPCEDTGIQEDDHVKMKAGTGVTDLQTNEYLRLSEAGGGKEGRGS